MVQGRHKYTSVVNLFQFDTTFEKKNMLLSYKMVQSSLCVLFIAIQYVHCSVWCILCALGLLVHSIILQFWFTVRLHIVYGLHYSDTLRCNEYFMND